MTSAESSPSPDSSTLFGKGIRVFAKSPAFFTFSSLSSRGPCQLCGSLVYDLSGNACRFRFAMPTETYGNRLVWRHKAIPAASFFLYFMSAKSKRAGCGGKVGLPYCSQYFLYTSVRPMASIETRYWSFTETPFNGVSLPSLMTAM